VDKLPGILTSYLFFFRITSNRAEDFAFLDFFAAVMIVLGNRQNHCKEVNDRFARSVYLRSYLLRFTRLPFLSPY